MSECDKCNGWGVDDVTGFACPSCQTVKQTLTVEPVSNPDGLAAAMQADAAPVVDHPPTSNPVDDSETGNTSDKPDTTPAAHDITQADREAAAKAAALVEMRGLIRAGRADHHAEPWAAHRNQAERDTVARIVSWLRDNAWRLEDASTLAASIEAGEHLK